MTVRVRVRPLSGTWEGAVEAEGITLPHAVRAAVHQLHLGPGKTRAKIQIAPHEWSWDWSGHSLRVRVVEAGRRTPNGEKARPIVSLTLTRDELRMLDELAWAAQKSRGELVGEWIRERATGIESPR